MDESISNSQCQMNLRKRAVPNKQDVTPEAKKRQKKKKNEKASSSPTANDTAKRPPVRNTPVLDSTIMFSMSFVLCVTFVLN